MRRGSLPNTPLAWEASCCPQNPPPSSVPPCPPWPARSTRSPPASTARCSATGRNCSTACSTAATRPAETSAGRWPAPSPASPPRCWTDPDARPDALLARIAHKHAAVGVTDDQYTIVHKYLFGAIAEVLGDAVTPEVAAAWDEVYWLMAGALIAREARLYQEAGVAPGESGGSGRSSSAATETADVVSFLLRPADGEPAPRARAGPVRQRAGPHARRSPPAPPVQPVLRPGRRAAAHHRQTGRRHGRRPGRRGLQPAARPVREGDELTLSAPFGDVVLDDGRRRPAVLVSAGIGCTPMTGMLAHLAAPARPARCWSCTPTAPPPTTPCAPRPGELVEQLPGARARLLVRAPRPGGTRRPRRA